MPGSGLHRQVKVLWRGHRPATTPNFCRMQRAFLRTASPSPSGRRFLSDSQPISGSDLPGQAGSPISCEVFLVSSFGVCGFAGSFLSYLLGRMMEWLSNFPLIRRWSRHRHKRVRGIGSQAASRRGVKKPPFSPRFQGTPFSILARVSRWTSF